MTPLLHSKKCVKCGICTAHCVFLKKHNMNLMDYEGQHQHHHGSCMACKKCHSVCPKQIDGSAITQKIRRSLHGKGQLHLRPYNAVLVEKKVYLFKNYTMADQPVVFFPGCNFSAYFPKSTLTLSKILKEKIGAGLVFECCSKPIFEMGMEEEALLQIRNMEQRLTSTKVKEIITACPNCTAFLGSHFKEIKVTSIYDLLQRIDYPMASLPKSLDVFTPCPDRSETKILSSIASLLPPDTVIKPIDSIQCCGLGGLAACVDKSLPQQQVAVLKAQPLNHIYTYCATCYGNFRRNGLHHTSHLLLDLLNLHEPFPKGFGSVLNRATFTFQKKLK